MLNQDLLTPFAHAKQERFLREAEEWRLYRSLGDQPSRRSALRRRAGQFLARSGGYVGDISLDDCLQRQQQPA